MRSTRQTRRQARSEELAVVEDHVGEVEEGESQIGEIGVSTELESLASKLFNQDIHYFAPTLQICGKPETVRRMREILGLPPREDLAQPGLKGVPKP